MGRQREGIFTIDQGNHRYYTMILKCIQHTMEENLLWLRDLLEL